MATHQTHHPAAASTEQRSDRSKAKSGPHINLYVVASVAALGGLLFGFDTGVISGAQLFLVKTFSLTSTTEELAVSAVLIGAIIGAAISGKIADRIGRRWTLIGLATVFGAGAILTALAPNLALFVAFRILVGIGVGGASVVAPMYTSELAPPDKRGSMVFLFQLAVTIGIAVAYWSDLAFSQAGAGWRPMFAVAVVPAVILGLGMLPLTDTPRWLGSRGHWDEATAVMERINPDSYKKDIEGIRKTIEEEKSGSLRELFRPHLRHALAVGLGLAVLQQFVGINTIIYYAPTIFGYAGIASANSAILATSVVGVLNVVVTVAAVLLVDRIGRRWLLLGGLVGITASMAATGLLFAIGPKSAGGLLLACLLVYIASFAIGMGPVFWLLSQEVFPTKERGNGSGVSVMGNWSANLIVSITFLSLIAFIGKPGTFWIYAGFGLLTFFFSLFLVPETKGRTLEEVQQDMDE